MRSFVKSFPAICGLSLFWACSNPSGPLLAADGPQTPQAAPAQGLIAEFSTSCRSETQFACGVQGECRQNDGLAQEPAVTFAFQGPVGAGELCVLVAGQSVCRAVAVNAVPGETPGLGESLTGLVVSEIPQDDAHAPTLHLFDGVVTLEADGASFRLVQANPDVAAVWSGPCIRGDDAGEDG